MTGNASGNLTGQKCHASRTVRGLTLIELLLIVAIVGVLAQVAAASYSSYVERTRVANARKDITIVSTLIKEFQANNGRFPADLAEVGNQALLDPWGRPYVYLDVSTQVGRGESRRDRNLNPLNSDFDLYSLGKDGVSKKQITNKDSLDDVIRANDGVFIDLASKYVR